MPLDRRRFLGTAAAAAAAPALAADAPAFASRWPDAHDRIWLGPEFWANPLQDWRLAGGRIECVNPALDRNVHLLTRQLGAKPGDLTMTVRVGRVGGNLGDGKGSAGFRVGIAGPLGDYRNALVYGTGLDAGLTADGGLFVGQPSSAKAGTVPLGESLDLRLTATPTGNAYTVTLEALDPANGKVLGKATKDDVPADRLVGNVALVANFGKPGPAGKKKDPAAPAGPGTGAFWFADWKASGSKLDAHDDRAFGPILFTQYTLSRGVLKLTAQLVPVGKKEARTVRLKLRRGEEWVAAGEVPIDPLARTATFRVAKWDATKVVPYRVEYTLASADGRATEHTWEGTVRRDPVDKPVLTVADISCNTHQAFPNTGYVAAVAKLDPDLIAFVGDQFYESTGGYGVVRGPVEPAVLDYLRKWYIHGWTWRDLTRDRPSVSLPDDHDVYQGNLWGEGGAAQRDTQENGGYNMPAAWVNVVHRTQASHHPDGPDPKPGVQGVSVYYGPLTYGRVSFAILADRQFKSGPEGKVPPTGGRGDHVTDPNFDPKTADVRGLQLLGDRQMKFLREWAADWRGAEMKAVISQTVFTAMATTHGGERARLRADYDSNAWPQAARNEALREMRRAFAVHLAGDQHLPAVVHYGIEAHRDAGVAFAGPAVNVGYPRWWEPSEAGKNRKPGAGELTGDFTDHFGHPLTVLAVANGAVKPRPGVLEGLTDKASGLGVVRFDKANRRVTFECWPLGADVAAAGTQFPGWPITVDLLDNYGRAAVAHLPTVKVNADDPVVEVVREADGEVVYAVRIRGREFRPKVFAAGKYTVRVSDPDGGKAKEVTGVEPGDGVLDVTL